MKVTVTKYLNVRVGKPSLNAPCYQYLAPGSELEIEEEIIIGDFYEGCNSWVKDKAGNYYWKGGIGQCEIPDHAIEINRWHIEHLHLEQIEGLTGKDVKVLLIDSGIKTSHPEFSEIIKNPNFVYKNFKENELLDFNDYAGHGTECAGVICGKMTGIAKEIDLTVFKISCNQLSVNLTELLTALSDVPPETKIINLSLGFSSYPSEILLNVLNRLAQKTVIIAAIGDLPNVPENGYYPAKIKEVCFPVGSHDIDGNYPSAPNASEIFLLPGEKILTSVIDSTDYSACTGSSYATAILTALVALYLQKHPNASPESIKEKLKSTATTAGNKYTVNPLKFLKNENFV